MNDMIKIIVTMTIHAKMYNLNKIVYSYYY